MTSSTATILGIAPLAGRVGLAVVSREHLVTFAVISARSIPDLPREAVRGAILRRLKAFPVRHVALVEAVAPAGWPRTIAQAVEDLARERALRVSRHARADLRLKGGGTYRRLAARCLGTYPELRARIRLPAEVPGHRGITTSRETPMWALVLAIAACEQVLAGALEREAIDLQPDAAPPIDPLL